MEGDKGLNGRGTSVDGVQKSAELDDILGLDDSTFGWFWRTERALGWKVVKRL